MASSSYRVCGHCDKLIGPRTYRDHKRLFFHEGVWLKEKDWMSVEDNPGKRRRQSPSPSGKLSDPPSPIEDILPEENVCVSPVEENSS